MYDKGHLQMSRQLQPEPDWRAVDDDAAVVAADDEKKDKDEVLLSFLYIQTPDKPPTRRDIMMKNNIKSSFKIFL